MKEVYILRGLAPNDSLINESLDSLHTASVTSTWMFSKQTHSTNLELPGLHIVLSEAKFAV